MGIPILAFLSTPQYSEMKNKKAAAGIAIFIAAAALAIPKAANDPSNCKVSIGYPHISKFIQRNNGYLAVKVNAYSKCDRTHSRVTLTVELWKEELLLKKRIRKTVARHLQEIPAGEKFRNLGTFVRCNSDAKTLYFAKAYAKAWIDGKWQFATDRSKISIPVFCGT
jgi:hypothetical protein